VVVILMLLDVFRLDIVRVVFIVPAVAQILLALPVLVAIIRRRPLTVPRPLAGWGRSCRRPRWRSWWA